MQFFSLQDLISSPDILLSRLPQDGELVISNNGTPTALMIHIPEGQLEEIVKTVRQVKAMLAFNVMHRQAAEQGYFSQEDIESEIAAVRQAKKRN